MVRHGPPLRFVSLAAAAIIMSVVVSVPSMAVEMPERGICAHRGAMATHPENTLAAFQEAIRLGAHAIEFDVKWTKDQQLVLMHDATVDRTTNGTGRVSDYTLAEIKQLDAGSWKGSQFAGERIPTLAESLAIMPHNTWVMVHLYATGADLAGAAADVVIGAGLEHQTVFLAQAAEVLGIERAERDSGKDIMICNTDTRGTGTNYVDQTINGRFDFLVFSGGGFPLAADMQRLKDNGVRTMFYGTDDPDTLTYWFDNGIEFPVVDDLASSAGVAQGLGIEPLAPILVNDPLKGRAGHRGAADRRHRRGN
ncbi:MAG: glycerophosphodiester phosphodiesterase family protein [Planctomycetota bacterium]